MEGHVPLKVASHMASCSSTTIRRWIKQKLIKATTNSRGNWFVDENSLRTYLATADLNSSRLSTSNVHHKETHGAPRWETVDDMMTSYVKRLEDDIQRERAISDDLRSELKKSNEENRALLVEMKAFLTNKTEGSFLSRFTARAKNSL